MTERIDPGYLRLCDACCDNSGTAKEMVKTGGCTCDICGWACACCGDRGKQFVNRIPVREMGKRQEILTEMEDVAAETEALEYLDSRGAKLLTRPAGWHFQTTKERFLLHEKDAVEAASELRKLLAAGKRLKKPKKKQPAKK